MVFIFFSLIADDFQYHLAFVIYVFLVKGLFKFFAQLLLGCLFFSTEFLRIFYISFLEMCLEIIVGEI